MTKIVRIKPGPPTESKSPVFFMYQQNNSGGRFEINDNVTVYVIIEAHTGEEADRRAQDVGIYFDGCDTGNDCPCCGDRWYAVPAPYKTEPDYVSFTQILNDFTKVEKESWRQKDHWVKKDQPFGIVYFLDGEKVLFVKEG